MKFLLFTTRNQSRLVPVREDSNRHFELMGNYFLANPDLKPQDVKPVIIESMEEVNRHILCDTLTEVESNDLRQFDIAMSTIKEAESVENPTYEMVSKGF